MPDLVLVIGNRNYSSWSLRGWLALEHSGLPFREEIVWFDEDPDRARRREAGPTGRVPVLRHGDVVIPDSLAIAEYVAELAPGAGLWPEDRTARAAARAICAEMHAGFPAIRSSLPMNVRARREPRDRPRDVRREIDRMTAIWTDTREAYGRGGPFLFGRRSLADAFFAPVAFRFRTYAIPVEGEAAGWMETILDLPAMRDWAAKAEDEGHPQPAYDALP